MGSEGPFSVSVYVTGFKKFHGVKRNPTEEIVTNLKEFMVKKGLPKGLSIEICEILETAGQGALTPLNQFFQFAILGLENQDDKSSNARRTIMIHFGVNSGASRFAIESQAVNEATFHCPDELGWKPQKTPIVLEDGGIGRIRKTTLPVKEIKRKLEQLEYPVVVSEDAGRFVCNYVYYHSLRFAEELGIQSLFVHVPLFMTINEEKQMQFVASLLEVLASLIQ